LWLAGRSPNAKNFNCVRIRLCAGRRFERIRILLFSKHEDLLKLRLIELQGPDGLSINIKPRE
jgi:hypothetical protein